ncbi:phage tail assembly chaperone [Falsihalocynthiibacter sp. S25ZX9]
MATVDLGWPPSEFWTATPKELWAAYDHKVKRNKGN